MTVHVPLSRVSIAGETIPHAAWSTSGEATGLPGSSADATAATGTIALVQRTPVTDIIENPLARVDAWPPKPGDPVTVDGSTDGGTTWTRVFTGVVDSSTAATDAGGSVTVVDYRDSLRARVELGPYGRQMPPVALSGNNNRMIDVGMHHLWAVSECARAAGFYPVNPYLTGFSQTGLRISFQGSLLPTVGDIRYGAPNGVSKVEDCFVRSAFGLCARGFEAYYDGTLVLSSATIRFAIDVGAHSAGMQFDYTAANNAPRFSIAVAAGRTVQVRTPSGVNVATLAGSSVGQVVVVQRTTSGGTDTWTIKSGTASATGSSTATVGTFTDMHALVANGARVGEYEQTAYVPSAVATSNPTAYWYDHDTTSSLPGLSYTGVTTAKDVLNQIAAATCSWVGFQPDGSFIFVPVSRLLAPAPAKTLTTKYQTFDKVSMTESLTSQASSVQVTYDQCTTTASPRVALTVWQGSTQTLTPGETDEQIISPGSDEDWIGVDLNLRLAGQYGDAKDFNDGRGTWAGAVVSIPDPADASNQIDKAAATSQFSASISHITASTWKLVQTCSGTQTVSMRSGQNVGSSLASYMKGVSLPIIRAGEKLTWKPDTKTAGAGPSMAQILTIDAGRYSNPTHAQAVATFAATVACNQRVTLDALSVFPDLSIKPGDMITISSPHLLGVDMDVLVGSRSLSFDPSGSMILGMTISCLIKNVRITRATFRQLENLWRARGGTIGSFEALWSGKTFANFEAEPLT